MKTAPPTQQALWSEGGVKSGTNKNSSCGSAVCLHVCLHEKEIQTRRESEAEICAHGVQFKIFTTPSLMKQNRQS